MLKTKNGNKLAIKELNQKELINTIKAISPDLAQKIKFEDNESNQIFYLASYRFGDKIINDGVCYLPLSDGGNIAFDDPSLPDDLKNDLSYNAINEDPLGITLNKISEFYLPGSGESHVHSLLYPGQMFGVPRAISNTNNSATSVLGLNLIAGVSSIFMLPKISDQTHHVHLQELFGMSLSTPETLHDHHDIFVEIANKSNCAWRCEILYFPRSWINKLKCDTWATLAKHLLLSHHASYSISHKVSDIWHKTFQDIEQEKLINKKYPMQSLTTTKLLFMIAANIIPGFKPATNDDSAPISLIQQVYNDTYNKYTPNKHSPIIMEPGMLNGRDINHVYHSINYSSAIKKHLEIANKKSQIAWLEEIRQVLEIYNKAILNRPQIKSLFDISKNTNFSFYHSQPNNYNQIHNASLLEKSDSRFIQNYNGEFPYSSPFFKGCIRISQI